MVVMPPQWQLWQFFAFVTDHLPNPLKPAFDPNLTHFQGQKVHREKLQTLGKNAQFSSPLLPFGRKPGQLPLGWHRRRTNPDLHSLLMLKLPVP